MRFYDQLIDCLHERNIEPWVTLYHWDLPLSLMKEGGGLISPEFPSWFEAYASLCFDRFGDRVKRWITFNEPWCSAKLGYGSGDMAPGRVSTAEPYLPGHRILQAHGRPVLIYRARYTDSQKGLIGMSNNCDWREPLSSDPEDRIAAERSLERFLGWFADPIYRGDYPDIMRSDLGDELPGFTDGEREALKGSISSV